MRDKMASLLYAGPERCYVSVHANTTEVLNNTIITSLLSSTRNFTTEMSRKLELLSTERLLNTETQPRRMLQPTPPKLPPQLPANEVSIPSSQTISTTSNNKVHHHVHEHVQPVIQKETLQGHVVHTTIPIHETHHNAAVHHGTSTLPTKTLEEFTSERGGLGERAAQKLTEFEGCPKPYRQELQNEQLAGDKSMHLHGNNYGENQAQSGREGHGIGHTAEGLAAGGMAGAGATAASRKHRHGLGHKDRRGSGSSSSSMSSSDEESRGLGKSSKHKNRGLGSSTGTGVGAGAAAAAAGAAHNQHQSREGGIPGTSGVGSGMGSTGMMGNTSTMGAKSGNIGNPNTAGLNKPHGGEYDSVKTGGLHNDPLKSNSSHVSLLNIAIT